MPKDLLRFIPLRRSLLLVLFGALAAGASAQLQTLHSMAGLPAESGAPCGNIAMDVDGNIYGVNSGRLQGDRGNVWKLTPSGSYTVLHTFSGADGSQPLAGVTLDPAGNLYGTTADGGPFGGGTVWKITQADGYVFFRDLHDFEPGATDGSSPLAEVTLDSQGNLYGTTYGGGEFDTGILWEIDRSGQYHVLHHFGNTGDGQYPRAQVTVDGTGNIFGTTFAGGSAETGTLWELTSAGSYSVLHSFDYYSGDGAIPETALVHDDAGNLYGVAPVGGSLGGGTLFEWSVSGQYSTLCNFPVSDGTNTVPSLPISLTRDTEGNFYGISMDLSGTLWQVTPSGVLQTLHTFSGTGTISEATTVGLLLGPDNNFYGTTYKGGTQGFGSVFRFVHAVSLSTSRGSSPEIAGGVGKSFSATITLPDSFPGGTVTLSLSGEPNLLIANAENDSPALFYSYTNVPAGAGSRTFTITAPIDVSSPRRMRLNATATGVGGASVFAMVRPFVQDVSIPGNGVSGLTTTGRVTVFEAPATKQKISLTTSLGSSGQPTQVTVAANATVSSAFTLKMDKVSVSTPETCTATLVGGESSATTSFIDNMPYISGLTFQSNPVVANTSTSAIVTITGLFPTAQTLTLRSGSSIADDITVSIPAGASTATGTVTPSNFASTSNQHVSFTGTLGVVPSTGLVATKTAALTVVPYQLARMETSSPIAAGTSGTLTVFLTAPAQTNAVVMVTSANPALISSLTVPVPAGSNSATVPLPVAFFTGSSARSLVLTGKLNTSPAVIQRTTVSVAQDAVVSMSLSDSSCSELRSTRVTVNLAYAPATAGTVSVTSSIAGVVHNFSVPIPANQSSGSITISPTFTALAAKKSVTLTAAGTTVNQVLDVYPEVLSVAVPTVTAPHAGTVLAVGIVTLFDADNPAEIASGFSATSSSPYATVVPGSFVLVGNVVLFNIRVSPVPVKQVVTLTLQGLGYTRIRLMTIRP